MRDERELTKIGRQFLTPWALRHTALPAIAGAIVGAIGTAGWLAPAVSSPQACLAAALIALGAAGVLLLDYWRLARSLGDASALREQNTQLLKSLLKEKEEAERTRDAAQASVHAKSAFIANISHEIRTPLNALLGMTQLLERTDLDRSQRGYVQVVLEAGRGLKTLLDDVLALSGSDTGSEDAALECDPGEALRTVSRLLQPRAWEKQLRLTVTAPASLPAAQADPRRVRQVLLKLADNALKFTERGGVELRAELEPGGKTAAALRFSVIDTGLGLAAQAAGNLFEPFSTGENSYARHHDGAGLGLAVAKRLVEAMGGQIGCDSAPGEGATFWFRVPAAAESLPLAELTEPIAGDCTPPAGLALLLALEDAAQRQQIAALLEPFGNRLTLAASLGAAIGLAGRGPFDAIIADGQDADMLAAAPGVSAPVIALLGPGSAMPMAAASVLRWPAPAAALYQSLTALLGRGAETPAPQPDNPAIDAAAFAGLEKSLGLTTLIEILHSYVKTAEDLSVRLAGARAAGQWDEASRLAQDIAGAAGGLGLSALTNAARAITQTLREGGGEGDLARAIDHAGEEHARVCKALTALYPDLAA